MKLREEEMVVWTIVVLFVILSGLILSGCGRNTISPVGNVTRVEMADVEAIFDFTAEAITVHNNNNANAKVKIYRKVDGVYITLIDAYIRGWESYVERANFDHGDKIKFYIKMEGEEWTDYFTLG